eukprot:gene1864-2266_t
MRRRKDAGGKTYHMKTAEMKAGMHLWQPVGFRLAKAGISLPDGLSLPPRHLLAAPPKCRKCRRHQLRLMMPMTIGILAVTVRPSDAWRDAHYAARSSAPPA